MCEWVGEESGMNGGFSRGRNVIGMKYECLGGPLGSLCKLNHWLTDVVVVAG